MTYTSSCACGVCRFGERGRDSSALSVPRWITLTKCAPGGPGMQPSAAGRRITALRSRLPMLTSRADARRPAGRGEWREIATVAASLDHFVCARQYRLRDVESQRPGRLEVDDELEGRGLLDREIGRPGAPED